MTNYTAPWLAAFFVIIGGLLSVPAHADCSDKPGPKVDWTKCTKMRLVLRNDDLSEAILKRTNLSSTDLAGANLAGATLAEANIDRARLQDADLTDSDLRKVQGSRANFREANLAGARLTKSELLRANFSGANLEGTDLSKAELGRANFTDSDLDGANLSFSNIARATFKDSELEDVEFTRAYTYLTRFEGVDLTSTTGLSQVQLELACGNDETQLPEGLEMPANWPCAGEE